MRRKYPWKEWFRKRRLQLVRGRDYDCSPGSFAQQLRNAASVYGIGISVETTEDDTFIVQIRSPLNA